MVSKALKVVAGVGLFLTLGIILAIALPLTLIGDDEILIPEPSPEPTDPSPGPGPEPGPEPIPDPVFNFKASTKNILQDTCFISPIFPAVDKPILIGIETQDANDADVSLVCVVDEENESVIHTFEAPDYNDVNLDVVECTELYLSDGEEHTSDVITVKKSAFGFVPNTQEDRILGEILTFEAPEEGCVFELLIDGGVFQTYQLLNNIETQTLDISIIQENTDVIYDLTLDIAGIQTSDLGIDKYIRPANDTLILSDFTLTPSSTSQDWSIPVVVLPLDIGTGGEAASLHHKLVEVGGSPSSTYEIVLEDAAFEVGSYTLKFSQEADTALDFNFDIVDDPIETLTFSPETLTALESTCFVGPEERLVEITIDITHIPGVEEEDVELVCIAADGEVVVLHEFNSPYDAADVLIPPTCGELTLVASGGVEYESVTVIQDTFQGLPANHVFGAVFENIDVDNCDLDIELAVVTVDGNGDETETVVTLPYTSIDFDGETVRVKAIENTGAVAHYVDIIIEEVDTTGFGDIVLDIVGFDVDTIDVTDDVILTEDPISFSIPIQVVVDNSDPVESTEGTYEQTYNEADNTFTRELKFASVLPGEESTLQFSDRTEGHIAMTFSSS